MGTPNQEELFLSLTDPAQRDLALAIILTEIKGTLCGHVELQKTDLAGIRADIKQLREDIANAKSEMHKRIAAVEDQHMEEAAVKRQDERRVGLAQKLLALIGVIGAGLVGLYTWLTEVIQHAARPPHLVVLILAAAAAIIGFAIGHVVEAIASTLPTILSIGDLL